MAFTPKTWADGAAGGTPITAAELNRIESGISAADTAAATAPTWASVTGKPATFAPATHSHAVADVTGLQAALDGKQASGSYAAATHTHAIANVTNLQSSLDGKAAATHTHAIADVSGLQAIIDDLTTRVTALESP